MFVVYREAVLIWIIFTKNKLYKKLIGNDLVIHSIDTTKQNGTEQSTKAQLFGFLTKQMNLLTSSGSLPGWYDKSIRFS